MTPHPIHTAIQARITASHPNSEVKLALALGGYVGLEGSSEGGSEGVPPPSTSILRGSTPLALRGANILN